LSVAAFVEVAWRWRAAVEAHAGEHAIEIG
jgi:hypothetical protein